MAASSSPARAACALLLLLGVAAEADAAVAPNQEQVLGSPAPSRMMNSIECGSACAARQNLCKKACRCNCMPPGTSGNQDKWPCYANVTTHGGRPKCP